MSRELRRIQRLRDLKGHRERAAERELAAARRDVIHAEDALAERRNVYVEAIDGAAATREIAADDFELERLRIVSLARQVETAESTVAAAQSRFQDRSMDLAHAHKEVEQMDRWAEITRTAVRADEQRLDRIHSDETAARLRKRA